MKKVWKLLTAALTLTAAMACLALPAMAEEGYTYTVTISAGGLEGASLNPAAISGTYQSADVVGDKIVITGVPYNNGEATPLNVEGAVTVGADSKYAVRGYARSGQDYDTAVKAVVVRSDTDLVAAYSVPGQQVAYTVRYQDGDGNDLAESQTFYGTIGDKPVATYVYVEGYLPQALNLTKTLSADEAENVFTFVYTPVVQEVITTAAEAETPVVEGAAAEGAEGAEAAGEEAGEVPAEPQELIDLDEDEVPLAQASDVLGTDGEGGGAGASGVNKGAVIGGGIAAAVVVLGALAVALAAKKKKKANT